MFTRRELEIARSNDWLIKYLLKASLADDLWACIGFTPTAPGIYIFMAVDVL